jgi:hypothetical protein
VSGLRRPDAVDVSTATESSAGASGAGIEVRKAGCLEAQLSAFKVPDQGGRVRVNFGRGDVLAASGAQAGTGAISTTTAATDAGGGVSRAGGDVPEEAKSLDSLYADARHEGGKLVIYAGGDTADQQDAAKQAFLSQFPDIDLTLIVDYSKYHDVRIDNQLATGTLVPDVMQLQTTQDFTRWKEAGVLRLYKPSGFSKVYPGFKDPDGAWVAIAVYAFGYMYDDALGTGITVQTINPGAYNTGFSDRLGESTFEWHDDSVNFTREADIRATFDEIMKGQYDPQGMIDHLVAVIGADDGKYRNVWPPETEEFIKQVQATAWTRQAGQS